MKFLFFSDTHLGFDHPINPHSEQNRRGKDFFQNYEKILVFGRENQVDLVLHGGDFFFRSKVHSAIIDKAYSLLYNFADHFPIVIVPGNHERSILPNSFLTAHKNIFIFDEPKTFFFQFQKATIAISGFPNVRENIRYNFSQLLQLATEGNPFTNIKLLLLHQAIENSKIAGFTFRTGKNVIPQKLLPRDHDAILAGHIHRAQIIQNQYSSAPIIYPGSIERTSTAEIYEEKGFFLLEFLEDKPENWSLENIEFVKLPTRQMVKLEIDLLTEDQNRIGNWLAAKISRYKKDAVIRLYCDLPATRKLLTAKFLRNITSPQMHLTLAPLRKRNNKFN